MIAALASACSSDVARFSENPFSNPFQTRTAFDPVTTSSVNGPRAAQQAQKPLANIRNSQVTTQPLPAPNPGMLSAAPVAPAVPTRAAATTAAVAATGSVASHNYPRLAPVAPAAPSVLGAANGWTAVGGTPVVMQQGETVNTLSNRYGVPANAIMAVNGLSGTSQPVPGQQIIIPAYNAVQASGQRPAAPQAVARIASAAPPQALPAVPARAPLMQPPPARITAPAVAAAPQVRNVQPRAETEAEKRAAAKLAALRTRQATRDENDSAPAVPARKTEAQLKAEKAQAEAKAKAKAEAAKKAADAKKAEDAKKLAEAKADAERKAEATKKAAAAVVAARKPDPETTASIPAEPKAAARAEKPAAAAPQAEEPAGAAFRWPAQGRVIAGYGARGTGGANDGINIALPEGSPVRAAEGGTVVHADDALKGFGKLVLVRHADGFVTVYAHNGDLKVKRGEAVKRGQVIATSGQSGNVTSPQLHFQIRKGATPVDPMKYLASN